MTQITSKDTLKYITMIRVNFPDAFPTESIEDEKVLVVSWYEMLKCYPKEVCDVAVFNAIKHFEGYGQKNYPKINNVIAEIEKLRDAQSNSVEELWAELIGTFPQVRKWYSRFRDTYRLENGYTQGEVARMWVEHIFNNLSPELKEYCQTQRGLIEFASYTDEELRFLHGRFMKAIPVMRERAKMRYETDAKLAQLVKGIGGYLSSTNRKMIGGGDNV